MRTNLKHLPPDIIQQYNLHEKLARDGYVYIKIKKLMYSLKQSAVLSRNNLVKNIAPCGYIPCEYSTSLWRHVTKRRNFVFALMILVSNNFPIPMLITYWTLFKNITKYPWTLKVITTVYWALTENTTRNMSTFTYQLKSPDTSNVFSTLL